MSAHYAHMKGGKTFRGGAPRTDSERVAQAVKDNAFLDSCPTAPEHQCWKLRPRLRVKEIGNEVRHGPNLQQMRLMDDLGRNTGKFYTIDDVNGYSGKNLRAMNDFIRTGKNSFATVAVADLNHHESHQDLKEATKRRRSKINQTNFIVEPKEILSSLH